ncbi:MAG TPA: NUDIX domain-containing protein [Gammaproteobacteria bacterium]|nr:NUDIX domain-containing protein [Gammaproteobacteria bacterium]
MNKNDVKIQEESLLHNGFIQVKRYTLQHKLFAGGLSELFSRELVIRHHAAAALPYDPILDKIVLLEQFRVGALEDDNPWLIEIVAGLLEEGETPEALVHREMKEEAGLTPRNILPIFNYWASPGASNEHVSLFIAEVDARGAGGIHGLPHENEDIRVLVVDTQEALERMHRGEIKNAICLMALLWFQLHKDEVRAKWLTPERLTP